MDKCYHGGSSFDAIGTDFSRLKRKNAIIRADVTDAYYEPAPGVKKVIRKNLGWLIKNSPPTYAEGLVKTISEVRGIPKENVLVGGGSSDLMFSVIPNLSFESAVILDPMYGEFAHIVGNVMGKPIKRVKLYAEQNFKPLIEDVINATAQNDLVILVNPNNPTGQHIEKMNMLKLIENIPPTAKLLVDEAYIDYAGKYLGSEESLETLTTKHENLVVLKSMSKFYALSGLRVGYLSAHPSLIERLQSYVPPWSVNLLGQIAGIEALKDEDYYRSKAHKARASREEFMRELNKYIDIKVIPSSTNFFLLKLPEGVNNKKLIGTMAKQHGIYLRDPTSQGTQLDDSYVRISVKSSWTNYEIIHRLMDEVRR